jgi:hypothetical protein
MANFPGCLSATRVNPIKALREIDDDPAALTYSEYALGDNITHT